MIASWTTSKNMVNSGRDGAGKLMILNLIFIKIKKINRCNKLFRANGNVKTDNAKKRSEAFKNELKTFRYL